MGSSTAGAAPPMAALGVGLGTGRHWHHRAMQRSRALVKTYLLSAPVAPTGGTHGNHGTRDPLRLPSLPSAHGAHRQPTPAPLSLSEPALFTPGERAVFEGFSRNCRPSATRKRPPPPLPPCRACDPSGRSQNHQDFHQHHQDLHQHHQDLVQSCGRPVYTHFSKPIRPISKPAPVKPGSRTPTLAAEGLQTDRRPLVLQQRHSFSQADGLSVVGRPCLPRCGPPPPTRLASAPGRTQLHVFLPTGGGGDAGDGGEADGESVDEGFMDELDNRIISLKLQQGAPKTGGTP